MSKHLQQIINAILNPDQPRAQVPSFSYRGPGQVKPVTPGLEQPKDNMFARPMYAEGGKVGEVIPGTSDVILRDKPKEVAQRGIAVPFAEMSDGTTEWALPLILGGGLIDLVTNFGKYGDDDQYNTEQVMNALPVSGFGVARAAMRPAKGGMELGIFGGRNSKTADLDKLRLAEEFEAKGFAPELIRKGTGWFRGADKQWRYEIDDSQMTLRDLDDQIEFLGDAIKHDKLFEAYPELKYIPFDTIDDKRFYGMYHPPFGAQKEKISFRPSLDEKTIGQTLIHELQHAIQNKEGFSSGSHPDFFQRTPEQIDALANQAKDYLSAYVLRKLLDKGMSESDAILKITQDYGAIAPGAKAIELANKRTAPELDEAINYVQRVIRNASQPHKAYQSVTGEAEAMAAMKRKDLNELQRLQRSPLIDEGIPRNEQIIIDHRTGLQKPAAMTNDEFLKTFTGDNPYDEMHSLSVNPKLREGHPLTPKNEEAVKRLDSIFAEAPKTDRWLTVYRGAPEDAYGKQTTDKAFLSTTTDKLVAEEFADNIPDGGKVYTIKVEPGTPYLDVHKNPSPGMEYQQEIMFPRNSILMLDSDGTYILRHKPRKASGGSVTDKMLEARARAIEPAAPNLGTTIQPREAEARAYDPTWRDQITQTLLGDNPSPEWRNMVQGITGSSAGLGTDSMGLLDVTPAGLAFAGQEGQRAAEEGDYLTAGLNAAAFLPMGRVPQALNKAKMFSMGAELARDLQPKGTLGQYIGQLTNAGVKPVELRNAGLIDDSGRLLVDPNTPMTRDQLAEMLQTKLPEVDEVLLAQDIIPKSERDRFNELSSRSYNGEKLTPEDWQEYNSLAERIAKADHIQKPRFDQYTIPGGENYREVLLKLPLKTGDGKKLPDGYSISRNSYGQYIVDGPNGMVALGDTEEAAINWAREAIGAPKYDPSAYQSSHWPGQPNVVAHLRMSDRTGPNGEKILHIEELQSDWGQQGRKKGFHDPAQLAEIDSQIAAKEQRAKELQNMLLQSIKREQPALSDRAALSMMMDESENVAATGRASSFFNSEEQALFKEWDNIGFELTNMRRARSDLADKGLPTAPYVTDTAQWTELGLKRALREAAEGGYDRLIITPGKEQAKRYNLSNVVNYIESEPMLDNTRKITINAREKNIALGVDSEGKVFTSSVSDYKGKSLDEIVGKDVAKKLMEPQPKRSVDEFDIVEVDDDYEGKMFRIIDKSTGEVVDRRLRRDKAEAAVKELAEGNPTIKLSGAGLDIGGKGMKDYYDKIVPNQLNKLLGKLDKSAKVEPYKIQMVSEADPYVDYNQAQEFLNELHPGEGLHPNQIIGDEYLYPEMIEWFNKKYKIKGKEIETLSVPITPKMREEIMKGLPGFKKGGRVLKRAPGGEVMLPEIVVGDEEEELPQAPWLAAGSPAPTPVTPLPDAPWTKPSRASAFGTAALQGLTANFYDELAGIYGAGVYEYLSGDPEALKKYDSIVKEERGKQKAAAEEYPWTSFAGEVIGSIPAMAAIPFSPAARGLNYAQQVVRSALAGGTYGTAAGAGAGTDAESRQEGALWGAGTGTLGGFAAPLVNKSMAWVYDRTLRPVGSVVQGWMKPENVTAARLAGAIGQDQQDILAGKVKGLTLADWQAAKARGEPVTLADLGAGRTQALLRSAANSSPEGRAVIEEIIETRFKNQAERIATDIRNMTTGRKADALRTADQLRADYDAKRTPMYRKAFAQPNAQVMWDSELEQLSQAPVVQEAIRAALVSGKDAAAKAGFTPLKNPFITDPATNRFTLKPGQYPNLQFWDAVKKNLDGINSAEARFWARNLRNHLDGLVPEYGDARGMAHKFFGEEDALEAGRKLAGKKQIVNEQLARDLRKLSPEELELFREGYAYDLAERVVRNLSETRNLTKAIYNSPGERERILTVFGSKGAQKLEARMALETILDGARQALGNSTTARQLIEAGLAGGAAGAYFSGMDPQTTAFAAAVLAGGRGAAARSAMANEAMSGVRTVAGYVDRGVAKRVAEALVSDDPTILAEGIEMVIKNQKLRAGLTDLANATLNAGFARVGEQ